MPEIEAKLLLSHDEQVGEVLDALEALGHAVARQPPRSIVDVYYDTPDWLISRAGWTYRRREERDGTTLTLKSIDGSAGPVFVRDEIEQPLPSATKHEKTIELPSGPVQERLEPIINGHGCRELFRVSNEREGYEVTVAGAAGTRIELAVDRVRICAGKRHRTAIRFTELELELAEGDARTVTSLARALRERIGLVDARLSKFERGLRLAGLDARAESLRPSITRKSPVLDLARALVAREVGAMKLQRPRASEGVDPGGVHQMRIATRRLRAALRVFRDLLPADARVGFGRELRWLAGALGEVRDGDVFDESFAAYAALLPEEDVRALAPFRHQVHAIRRQAHGRLTEVLDSDRYRQLIADLGRLAAAEPTAENPSAAEVPTVGEWADRHIGKAVAKMLKRGRRLGGDATDDQLHRLRIRGKRLRYLMELFDGLHRVALRKPIKACKTLQDVLGEYHDDVVAAARVRAYAEAAPAETTSRRELLALGRLLQAQAQHAEGARGRFQAAWDRFERAARAIRS